MSGSGSNSDSDIRRAILDRLYEAFRTEGLYRGVVSKKVIGAECGAQGVVLERNLEYLLDLELIRMHKIEDLISISTRGIDYLECEQYRSPAQDVTDSLARIENLLADILEQLKKTS